MTHVILSHPKPVYVSGAIKLSSRISTTSFKYFFLSYSFFPILFLTNLIIWSLVIVSQIPSHPRIMNSSS